ncbi:hypothetical protein [Pseudoalteromonas mariniglutinosa]|uniref:hypothetical protein n=1 Tax=Pseudoalteromonas mariniglutinosa TaxID=206042 RepID=UPI00384C54B5
MSKYFFYCIIIIHLSGCTALGVLTDSYVDTRSKENHDADLANQGHYPSPSETAHHHRENGFSFSHLGLEIDQTIVEFFKHGADHPQLTCRQITRTIKECEEVNTPHQ